MHIKERSYYKPCRLGLQGFFVPKQKLWEKVFSISFQFPYKLTASPVRQWNALP